MKKWQVKETDSALASKLCAETGLNPFITYILAGRGITCRDEAEEFFHAEEISSPLEMADMGKAVEQIRRAIDEGKKITVYGDYDCDGITSTVMLFTYLQAIGGEADWYIPSRDEGYGLNTAAIDSLAENGTKLIITVDNGISALEEAGYIAEKGMELIITDHHQIPEQLPQALAIVNPHRADDYSSCKELAGCGVVLKLIMALEEDTAGILEQFGDLAAVGTVGDLVPLTGENRIIVRHGMENMIFSENIGLYTLLQQCGLCDEERLTSTALSFTVCPRINAAGRFAHPKEAAELFCCENPRLAAVQAEKLTAFNLQRQQTEQQIVEKIDEQIRNNPEILNRRVLVVSGEGWSHGVIGIVCSKLLTRYGKPTVIITLEGEEARGSARSVGGFSLYKLLDHCSGFLTKFGGHTKAAGFSLPTEKVAAFTEEINRYAAENYPSMPVDFYTADKELLPSELTIDNVAELNYLQPFGEGNPAPLFIMRNCVIKSTRSLKDGKYVSFNVMFGKNEYKALNFGMTYDDFWFACGDSVDLLVSAETNEYNGVTSVSLKVKEMRLSGFNQDKFFAAKSTYEKIKLGEPVNPALLRRIIPDKKMMKRVYDVIRNEHRLSTAVQKAFADEVNYCMFRVVLDVFEELGIAKTDITADRVELVPTDKKVDMTSSELLKRLTRQIEGGNS